MENKIKLTEIEYDILEELSSSDEMCFGYSWIISDGRTRRQCEQAIKTLKSHELILYYRGLMTDDGEVAGSGWCRSTKGNDLIYNNEKWDVIGK